MSKLSRFFRPSDVEVWRQLEQEIDARFEKGGSWHRDKIVATVDGWSITLDTYFSAANKNEYTRLQSTIENPDAFEFTVYRRGLFSELAKRLGMQDIEIGDAEFDRDFVLKSNDESGLRQLLADDSIRELIAAQPNVYFKLDKDGLLSFSVPEVILEISRLKALFDLFAATLDSLSRR